MWLWIIAAVVAYFVKGLCGFANTLVFTSILGFGTNNVDISPVDLVLGYPANIIMILKNRKKLNKKVCMTLGAMVLIGDIPGALLLKNIDAGIIKIIFGAVIIVVGIEMLLREYNKLNIGESKVLMIIIGLLSGAMCGLFGVGALMAAYVGRTSRDSDEFKANMAAVFAVDNTFRIVLYIVLGIFTVNSLTQALTMFPFMLLGLFLGLKCSKIVNERLAKILVIILLVVSGAVLIINNI